MAGFIWSLAEDLPLVIEIVDKPERIEVFLPELDTMIQEGLVTLEKVRVIAYRARSDLAAGLLPVAPEPLWRVSP